MTWRWISEGEGVRPQASTRPPALRDWLKLVVLTLIGVAAAGLGWRQPVPLVGKLLYEAALVYATVQPWRFELRRVERSRFLRPKRTTAVRAAMTWPSCLGRAPISRDNAFPKCSSVHGLHLRAGQRKEPKGHP